MNCSDFKAILVEHLDGRLSPERAAEARAHLESCADCRREAEFHRRTWELAGRIEAIETSPDFVASVRRRARRSRFAAIVGSCAAAAAVMAVIFFAPRTTPVAPAESELSVLPQEDRRLLEELATGRTWELADNIDLARAYELLEGAAAPSEEDH